MSIFNVLNLIGGLSIFLFGMNIMSKALERSAGNKMRVILDKMTSSKILGFFIGIGITAIIQSSATSVMVVGFVNSGLLTLRQAINIIMGANVGTTITAWILSLSGIDSSNLVITLLKPQSFSPILCFIGVILYLFVKKGKKKDTGLIFIGFSLLMFGMQNMSSSVYGLRNVPEFQNLFLLFTNPFLGVLVGAILTAIIQSSAASVGILQALSQTGKVTYGAAIPIIMGQNIGTCVTAIISATGTSKNARRTSFVHLIFNLIGAGIGLILFYAFKDNICKNLLSANANMFGIATAHSLFNIICTIILLPCSGVLEKIVIKLVPDSKDEKINTIIKLDKRLLSSPPLALEESKIALNKMAMISFESVENALSLFNNFNSDVCTKVIEKEELTDQYEDEITSFLMQLNLKNGLSDDGSVELSSNLKLIGDFERLADHALNLKESFEMMNDSKLIFSDDGTNELRNFFNAIIEVMSLTKSAFLDKKVEDAIMVEPLEEVIDDLKDELRTSHINRLREGKCSEETGYIWNDIITDLERVSDHCSNIAATVIARSRHKLRIHKLTDLKLKNENNFNTNYEYFAKKYKFVV